MAAAPLTALGDRTFGSLRRHRNYRLYFAGNGISFIGTWMQQIAAYWLILELTNSPVAVGALALVQTLPVTVHRARRRLDRGPGRSPADGDRLRGGAARAGRGPLPSSR